MTMDCAIVECHPEITQFYGFSSPPTSYPAVVSSPEDSDLFGTNPSWSLSEADSVDRLLEGITSEPSVNLPCLSDASIQESLSFSPPSTQPVSTYQSLDSTFTMNQQCSPVMAPQVYDHACPQNANWLLEHQGPPCDSSSCSPATSGGRSVMDATLDELQGLYQCDEIQPSEIEAGIQNFQATEYAPPQTFSSGFEPATDGLYEEHDLNTTQCYSYNQSQQCNFSAVVKQEPGTCFEHVGYREQPTAGDYCQLMSNNPSRRRCSLTPQQALPHRNSFGRQMSQETPSPTRTKFTLQQQHSFSDPSIPDSLRPEAPPYSSLPPRYPTSSSIASGHVYPSCSMPLTVNQHRTDNFGTQVTYVPKQQALLPPQTCVFAPTSTPFFKQKPASFSQVCI
uniref:BMP-2-inducible protein kinase-like n=1 Tax=Phallusia mammillata TaxID=59560 RepID=A0A6F9D743_9ASCI|nr:BMP-2-inducible protein kinase-like [Phallusia mammillata]